ncbi:isoprenylcysteine carboxylmethyltransferase family protein [Pusillimonas sp. ANT_WB101]|uniref:methyltransferase family protein n=1 Tax=Pusillimonas sp. ANT_WB101 TaxID=2597356 RepID=UPI0011EBB34C|nr:isoprenylcysteine carboxylmethyltransferase family protein [Pusillimonas sp. ANT_WB101]KAA0911494.1 isoprenylcysteine carboxylmethyltransferase family protein [Pusillimonas sp. ANT_WB101]
MDALELAVPPPVVMIVVGVLMWLLYFLFPAFTLPSISHIWITIIFVLAGLVIGMLGIINFNRAGTTSNPGKTAQVSALVTSGIYRFTRNPMYIGVLLLLIGWGVYLGNILALICAFIFVLYINRYQIRPEERLLERKFGDEYVSYKAKVRRWI